MPARFANQQTYPLVSCKFAVGKSIDDHARGISHADGISTLGQLNRPANPSPISYLGGSTTYPRLLWLLNGISYPTLWKRRLSASILYHASPVISFIRIRFTRDNGRWPVRDAMPRPETLLEMRYRDVHSTPEWKSRRPFPRCHLVLRG